MGSNASKTGNETAVHKQKPEFEVDANGDPRSPTPEVSRTPLHGNTGSKHNITKNVDLRKTFESNDSEEKLIHNNPILSAVIKNHLQSYDPRSPTQEFERTPIIISTNTEANDKNVLRLQTVNNCASPSLHNDCDADDGAEEAIYSPELMVPKNLCNGFLDITLNDTLKDTDEPLGSSTASNEAIEEYMSGGSVSKCTEFLETNFDYVESEEHFEDSEEYYDNIKEIAAEGIKNKKPFKVLENDPRSPSTGIERTPIVVSKVDDNSNGENVEEMSDDSLIKVLQSTNLELRQTKSLDNKNEELLIYEDEVINFDKTPKKSKSIGNSAARTPLSCMKNKADTGHCRSKSANINQNKVQKRVSHIPRLKSLSKPANYNMQTGGSLKNISKAGAIGGDCENTPPQSHRDRWDKDTSIVL